MRFSISFALLILFHGLIKATKLPGQKVLGHLQNRSGEQSITVHQGSTSHTTETAMVKLRANGMQMKGFVHAKIDGNPKAKTRFPIAIIHEGKKGGKIHNSFYQNPISNSFDHSEFHSKLNHFTLWPKRLPDPNHEPIGQPNPHSRTRDVKDASFRQGSLCVYIGERCLWPSDVKGFTHPDYWKHLPNRVHYYLNHRKDENVAHSKFQKNHQAVGENGFQLKSSSIHTFEPVSDSIQTFPNIEIQPGKESGHFFSSYSVPSSPSHPTPTQSSRLGSMPQTPDLINQLDHPGPHSSQSEEQNKRRKTNVDTTLRLGKRDFIISTMQNELQQNFQKRAGEPSSSHPSQPQHNQHQEIQKTFQNSIVGLTKEGRRIDGIMHVHIEGEPNAQTNYPTILLHEGKKGGSIVNTFLQQPLPKDHPTSSRHKTGTGIRQGCLSVFVGKCYSPSLPTMTDRRRLPNKVAYISTDRKDAQNVFVNEIQLMDKNKFHYTSTSTQTFLPNHEANHHSPRIEIQPGKHSVHLLSMYAGPTSSNHQQSNPNTHNQPRLLNLFPSTPIQKQHQREKRGRSPDSDHSVDSHRHRGPDTRLKLG